MATTLYCTMDDVSNRLSAAGVTYRLDDVPPDPTDGDVLDEASRTIDEHCLLFYTEQNLALSPTVKHWCANIAANLLCERRGNPVPGGIERKFDRTMKSLERVQRGRQIADIPMRKACVPVLSQPRIRLDPFPHTVIEKSGSTGTPEGYNQRRDSLDYLDWVI